MRLDKYIFENFSLKSRTFAENLIIKGKVKVDGVVCVKPSFEVSKDNLVEVDDKNEFASLGGDKLQKAITVFNLDLTDKKCVDIGASNGGFTDCMLRAGAKSVYAVDVAESALPASLINDGRVVVRDNLNARAITDKDVDGKCDFLSIDVSFISLKLVIPACFALLDESGVAVTLIKPQFELGKRAGKSGIVQNAKDRLTIVNEIIDFARELGYYCVGLTTVPKNFENKNIEYLALFTKAADGKSIGRVTLEYLNNL